MKPWVAWRLVGWLGLILWTYLVIRDLATGEFGWISGAGSVVAVVAFALSRLEADRLERIYGERE